MSDISDATIESRSEVSKVIFDRAMVREKSIWPSFFYGAQCDEDIKAIIFGLYANSYLQGHNYLEDIEAEELQRLVDTYTMNMAELDADDQAFVLSVASKRYTKAIDTQIKNNKLTTKYRRLEADEQEYSAKLAAFETDREALDTKRASIELAKDRAEIKNRELASKIELEGLEREYIAVDIAKKQLEASRADLKVLTTAVRGVEIQLDIVNTGLQITMAEVSKSQIDADIAGVDSRAASYGLEGQRLAVDLAEYVAAENEAVEMPLARIGLKEVRGESITADIENVGILEEKEPLIEASQIAEQTARMNRTIDGYDDQDVMAELNKTQSEYDDTADTVMAENRSESQQGIAIKRTETDTARTLAASVRRSAAVEAAKTMAMANITSTLTHQIGSS